MQTIAEAEAYIRTKLEGDHDYEFRNRLLQDPGGVILAETGVEVPTDKIAFVNEEISKGMLDSVDIECLILSTLTDH